MNEKKIKQNNNHFGDEKYKQQTSNNHFEIKKKNKWPTCNNHFGDKKKKIKQQISNIHFGD